MENKVYKVYIMTNGWSRLFDLTSDRSLALHWLADLGAVRGIQKVELVVEDQNTEAK